MKEIKTNKAWLYPRNSVNFSKKNRPVNYFEIVSSLKKQKHIESAILTRSIIALVLFLLVVTNFMGVIDSIVLLFKGYTNFSQFSWYLTLIFFSILGIYVFLRMLEFIILDVPKSLEKEITALLNSKIFFEAEIKQTNRVSFLERQLIYSFYNHENNLITGEYYTYNIFKKMPLYVRVIYLNEKLHTLL